MKAHKDARDEAQQARRYFTRGLSLIFIFIGRSSVFGFISVVSPVTYLLPPIPSSRIDEIRDFLGGGGKGNAKWVGVGV